MKTRRTAIAMLGLAPAATAIGAETFMEPPERPGDMQTATGGYNKERWILALHRLADAIKNNQVEVESLHLSAHLEADSIADMHNLHLRFRYKPEVG